MPCEYMRERRKPCVCARVTAARTLCVLAVNMVSKWSEMNLIVSVAIKGLETFSSWLKNFSRYMVHGQQEALYHDMFINRAKTTGKSIEKQRQRQRKGERETKSILSVYYEFCVQKAFDSIESLTE